MKSVKELREVKAQKFDEAEAILAKASEEKRDDLKDEEKTNYDNFMNEIEKLDEEIQRAEKREKLQAEMAKNTFKKKETREKEEDKVKRNYSLLRAIQINLGKEKFDGIEKEMHDEALSEARKSGISINGIGVPALIANPGEEKRASWNITTSGEGGLLKPTDIQGIIPALLNRLVLTKLGARKLTGLEGDQKFPRGGSISVAWEGENDQNTRADETLTSFTMSPNRLGAYALISKQLLAQVTNQSIEQYVQNLIINSMAVELEAKAINGSAGGNNPVGILNTSGIGASTHGANGGAPTRETALELLKEISVDNADGDKMAFLTNAKVRYKLQNTKVDDGSGKFVYDDNGNIIGYPAYITENVPSDLTKANGTNLSALVLGVWDKLLIGQWAGLDIIADPYTKADYAQTRLVINSWWDVALEQAEHFAAAKDLVTT